MECKKIFNRALSLLLAVCLAFGVLVIPPTSRDDGFNHVHAVTGSKSSHSCNIAQSGSTLTQDMMNAFIAKGTIDVGDYNFSYGPLFVYATEDISWSGELSVPEGVFIGVCTGGYSYEMGTVNKAGESGGVYVLDCSVVNTEHTDCQAYTDNTVVYMTQAWIDLYVDWAAEYAPEAPLFSKDQYIALAEDIHIRGEQWLPPEGVTLNICTNGKTFTTEGVDVSEAEGVNILDCTTMPKINHTCTVAGDKTIALTQGNISEWLARLEGASASDDITFMHLAEDITVEQAISAPEGVYVAICLNGFTLDADIDNSSNTTGGLFTYTCQPEHTCVVGTEKMQTIAVTQEILDFMEAYMSETGGKIEAALSLAGDVTFSSPEVWRSDYNSTLTICRNGHTITDRAGLNLGQGSVIYYDCNTMTLADINHQSQMFGSTYPMSQETLNGFSDTLGSFIVENSFYTNSWNYWSFIGNDGKLCYMPYYPVINADGTITPAGSTSYPEGDSFVLQSLYDENGAMIGYGYQVMAPDENNANSRYSRYLDILPVTNENGDKTGEVTLAFTDAAPVAVFNYSSFYQTYTATVDGVEYYLGSPDGSAVIAACPVQSLATGGKTFAYNRIESRYNGSDGMFTFHLTEDIVWDESIVIPEYTFVVIATNGHKITGNYTHGDKGGVYAFDDNMHACPKAGDGEPVMAVCEDFIDLMLVISGGEIEMSGQNYIALSDDVDYIDPRFSIPAGASLYICTNGHTISESALATLRAGGAMVALMDCSETGHDCAKLGDHEPEYANTYLFKNYYQDSNGVFALGPGEYYIYLYSNVNLSKTLIIPDGVKLHLCLNGFTLKSPRIITPSNNNEVLTDECYGAIEVQQGGSLTVYDCSDAGTGIIKINLDESMSGWGGLAAYAVCNSGTFVLDSGNLMGMMALLNSGEATLNGGNVVGILGAVAQSGELSESVGGTPATTEPTLNMNGGEIASAAFGIIGASGSITVDGGSVNAGYVGIATSIDDSSAAEGADISLSGCEINVGTGYEENFAAVGYPLEDEELGISTDNAVGIIASGSLCVDDDVIINVDESRVEDVEKTGDIMLGENSDVTIQKVNGDVVGTPYKVIADGDKTIPVIEAPADAIEVEEEMVIVQKSASMSGEASSVTIITAKSTAAVRSSTVSMDGLIKLNLYMQLHDVFVSNENARIIIEYKGITTEYKASDTKRSGDYYVLTLAVYAMDYTEAVKVSFTNGEYTWDGGSGSVDSYFNRVLSDTSGAYDEVTMEAVRYMKNFCMASAAHFHPEEHVYAPTADMLEYMNSFDKAVFDDYKNFVTGSSENVRIVSASLLLKSGTTARIYFQVNDGVSVDELEILVNGKAATATLYSAADRYYYVDVTDIAAHNLAQFQEISIDGLVAHYSGLTYCYMIMRTEDSQPEDLVNVCKAIYGYYKAADAYVNRD